MSSGQKAWHDEQEDAHEAKVAGEIRDGLAALAQKRDWELVGRKRDIDRLFGDVLDGAMFKPSALDALRKLRQLVA
jgi:hypothetical protein